MSDDIKSLRTSLGGVSMGSDEALLREIDSCIVEWSKKCGKALCHGEIEDYNLQKNQISTIQEWRRQIIVDKNMANMAARECAIKLIEAQRQLDESFSIPRTDDGEVVTHQMGFSVHHLLRLHRFMQHRLVEGAFLPSTVAEQYEAEQKLGIRAVSNKIEKIDEPLHLFMDMKMAIFKISEPFRMYFSVWRKDLGFVTDEFVVSLTAKGMPPDNALIDRLYTIFSNMDGDDLLQNAYLVCKIYRFGGLLNDEMNPNSPAKSPAKSGFDPFAATYQRPFGCGVKSFAELNLLGRELGTCSPASNLKVYRPTRDIEKNFENIHEVIISGSEAEREEVPTSMGIMLEYCVISGNLHALRENGFKKCTESESLRSKFLDASITSHIASDDITDPRDQREELFITLVGGEFSQGSKSTAKNIEITVRCVGPDGAFIPKCIGRGLGKQAMLEDSYSTTVYYHVNNPTYNETVRIHLPAVPDLLGSHLLLTVAHCSTGQSGTTVGSFRSSMIGGSKEKKSRDYFAFAFMPFVDKDGGGVVLGDGPHYLQCYNPPADMNMNPAVSEPSSGPTYIMPGGAPYVSDQSQLKIRTLKSGYTTSSQEYIYLHTYVSSVKFTHERAVHEFIRWSNCETDEKLLDVIHACTSLPDDSTLHCVREIIESTIQILSRKPGLADAAFKLCVNMLVLFSRKAGAINSPTTTDKKVVSEKAKQVIDDLWSTCVEKAFNSSHKTIHIELVRCLNTLLRRMQGVNTMTAEMMIFHRNTVLAVPIVLGLAMKQHMKGNDDSAAYEMLQQEMGNVAHNLNELLQQSYENESIRSLRIIFFDVFSIVESFYDVEEMAHIAVTYLRNLHTRPDAPSRQVKKDKLAFLNSILLSNIFAIEESREIVLGCALDILSFHFSDSNGTGEDRATSLVVLQVLLEKMEVFDPEDCDALSQVLGPLVDVTHKLMQGVRAKRHSIEKLEASDGSRNRPHSTRSRRGSCVGNTAQITTSLLMISLENAACCLCSTINLLGRDRVLALMEDKDGKHNGKQFLLSLVAAITLIIRRVIIPQPWLLLNMLFLSAVRDLIVWTAEYMEKNSVRFLSSLDEKWTSPCAITSEALGKSNPSSSNRDSLRLSVVRHQKVDNLILWSEIFNLTLSILLDPSLATESASMNEAKQAYLTRHYKDFRLAIIDSLSRVWSALSDTTHQIKFADVYTVPFIAVACSNYEPLANTGKAMVLDLLRSDFQLHDGFYSTAPHIYDIVNVTILNNNNMNIDSLYIPPRETLAAFMEGGLMAMFKADAVLNCTKAHMFASEMTTLLNLLRDLSECRKTLEFEEERSFAYAKLMDFFMDMGRRDAYIKAAHSLSKEMASLEHYTEAGNAILLHYNLLDWSCDMLESVDLGDDCGVLDVEPSWQRKKNLMEQAIDLLDKGKAWEVCVKLLDEMAEVYKTVRPDYLELVGVLERQVVFYRSIATEDRYFPTMFRVGYYGQGYTNESIRNKEFIYRGIPLESILDFSTRIKKKHPNSEVLPPKVTPNREEHFNSPHQFIQISKVTSANPCEAEGTPGPDISTLPSYMKADLISNNVNCFFYQRPFRKRADKSANEFLDLWVERKFLHTSIVFPSHTRRAEVTKESTVVLNPIEMAVQGLIEKNAELKEKNVQMAAIADGQAGQSFTMSLSGTVDAAVNGGIKNYESFITGSYRSDNPEIAEDIDRCAQKHGIVQLLKDTLRDQLTILDRGIQLHRKKCLESMQPLHVHIENLFVKMRGELEVLLSDNI